MFAYCKKHNESKMFFDTNFAKKTWTSHGWEQFYPDIHGETIPHDQPEARGNEVQINMLCDAAHATCHMTRRSTTGIICS
jgi:hypothetical protein